MSEKRFSIDSTLATIVLYNSSLEQSETFKTLTKALDSFSTQLDVMVYDNSPVSTFKQGSDDTWNIHYVHDATNAGVSKAYNESFKLAKRLNKKWLLLLDQDTAFPKSAMIDYKSTVESNQNCSLFVPKLISNGRIISPFKPQHGKGKALKTITTGKYNFDKIIPINSGILVNIDDFERCGGYNEAFPLDYSDFAFISRFRNVQNHFIVTPSICQHHFSGFPQADLTSTLQRFELFCCSTLKYKRLIDSKTNVYSILLGRALRLGYHFKTLSFLKKAFSILWRKS